MYEIHVSCAENQLHHTLFTGWPVRVTAVDDEKEAELSLPLGEVRNRPFSPFLPSVAVLQFVQMCQRADITCVRGQPEGAQLAATLAVQSVSWQIW